MRLTALSGLATTVLLLMTLLNVTPVLGQSVNAGATASVERLEALQSLLAVKQQEVAELGKTIRSAAAHKLPALNAQMDALNKEIASLQRSFERMAIGAVDLELFGEVDTEFDWRDELTQILQPLVENIKALTEKPRKIERLRKQIERSELQNDAIQAALVSIDEKEQISGDSSTDSALLNLRRKWERRHDQNNSNLEIAQLQLEQLLQGDETWVDSVKQALLDFFNGRGLTLLITVVTACLVWLFMRAVLWLFQRKPSGKREQDQFRTRRRLAQYAYSALTAILILVAVVTVFYVRGDRLLMGLSILAAAALALGLRHTIPRFLAETRLLLNIGATRENERVIYNGLPWRVVSLNMFTILRNPDLSGVVRLPLGALSEMVSRPVGKEPWFPSSKGDFILLQDGSLQEVVLQTTEMVELKNRGGAITSVPAADFYAWTFENLTRGGSFGLRCGFGIDYRHLDISLEKVPARFQAAMKRAMEKTEYGQYVKNIQVELTAAGSSSLDYGIFVIMHSEAAINYLKIDRLVQQTCVAVCVQENWGIPFPHLTVQKYEELQPSARAAA